MKIGRLKFFLPIALFTILSLVVSLVPQKALADDSRSIDGEGYYGSIRVCKIIVDENSNIVDGSARPGTQFSISGISPAETTQDPAIGEIGVSNYTSPLSFNAAIIGEENDAQCVTYEDLELGDYYYGTESINPSEGWAAPKYNDQYTQAVNSLVDFFDYDGNLFDANASNDEARNKNADGHIVLTSERPERTLVVLNRIASIPPSVGGGETVGGNITTPQCPTDKPQQVDQVWFTDVKPGEVTVKWANKGDAWGFQIAYGPTKDNLIWGVEVSDSKATQYTLKDLPNGDLWVSVIAKPSKECGGPGSNPKVVGQVLGASTLAATGNSKELALFLSGFSMISLGLWQAQKSLKSFKRS